MSNETGNERIETYEEDIAKLRDTHFDTRLDERVATAIMFNRLLDELKRCYEELDDANKIETALWNALDNWDICMDDYSMHDLYNNLDEKYARDDEGRIILKELYSYTEEDGWYREEHASE